MIMPGLSGYSVQFVDDNGIDALTFPKLESNWEPGYYVSEYPLLLWWTSRMLDQPVTLI